MEDRERKGEPGGQRARGWCGDLRTSGPRKRQICESPDRMRDQQINCNKNTTLNPKLCDGREEKSFGERVKGVRKSVGTNLYLQGRTPRGIETPPGVGK